jgi:hypothetical protein
MLLSRRNDGLESILRAFSEQQRKAQATRQASERGSD